MSEPINITDFAKILHDYFLTPEERELNSIQWLRTQINKTLVETGDLTECVLGKIETKQGAEHGICGELRETEKGRYWTPLYPEEARKYVEQVVLDHYDSIVKQPKKKTTEPADPATEKKAKKQKIRKTWLQLKNKYGSQYQIIMLEDPTGFWTFDEDAALLASICGVTLKKGTNTHNLIHNESSHTIVLKALKKAGVSHLLVSSDAKETKAKVPSKQIQQNIKFTLKESDGTLMKCIIQEFEGDVNSVEHVDGTEHIFLNPVMEFEDCLSLSPGAPLAQAALGHKKGDTFLCRKDLYTVADIDED